MKNIFEGANFGDKFLTKRGDIAIFQKTSVKTVKNADKNGNHKDFTFLTAILFTEISMLESIQFYLDDETGMIDYSDNGHTFNDCYDDIIKKL